MPTEAASPFSVRPGRYYLIKRGAKVGSPNALLVTESPQDQPEESLHRIPDPKRAIQNIWLWASSTRNIRKTAKACLIFLCRLVNLHELWYNEGNDRKGVSQAKKKENLQLRFERN